MKNQTRISILSMCVAVLPIFSYASADVSPVARASAAAPDANPAREAGKPGVADHEEVISVPPVVDVNPMTGKSIRYEEMEHTLRERTLEARIAEQDLAIAKSHDDQRKLSGDRSASAAVPGPVPDAVRSFPAKVVAKVSSTKRKASGGNKDTPPQGASAMPALERARFVGLMDTGTEKIALVAIGGHTVAVKEGSTLQGISVGAISGSNATINGVSTPLEKTVSTINLPETHQVIQPGANLAMASPTPNRGVVVQGVNSAAIQPVAPGLPLPGSNSQPVRFPNDLYNR
jgi:hypothetical protein